MIVKDNDGNSILVVLFIGRNTGCGGVFFDSLKTLRVIKFYYWIIWKTVKMFIIFSLKFTINYRENVYKWCLMNNFCI